MPQKETAKSKKEKNKTVINFAMINRLLCVAVICCSFYFLFCMNCLSTKGFELKEKRKTLNSLNKEHEKLELGIMAYESYQALNSKISALGMVKVDRIDIIKTQEGIAKK